MGDFRNIRSHADECSNFPDCDADCDNCMADLPHPLTDPEVMAEAALAEALRDMRLASGEVPSSEDSSEDVYAIMASLKRQGFAILPAA